MTGLVIVTVAAAVGLAIGAAPASSQEDMDCSDFAYQEDAQAYLVPGDPHHLDQDRDGIACQSLPRRHAPGAAPAQPTAPAVDCTDFVFQEDAQAYLLPGDPHHLDGDRDGVACETLPHRTRAPHTTPAPRSAPAPTTPRTPSTGRRRAERIGAHITRVVDGDTVKVRTHAGRTLTVRLIGIDTPETKRPGTPIECAGRQATAAMARMVLDRRGRGRPVRLSTDPTQDRTDGYGRLLAYVNLAGSGVDVGEALVHAGLSAVYVYDQPFARISTYRTAEAAAKAAQRGSWRSCRGDFHRAA